MVTLDLVHVCFILGHYSSIFMSCSLCFSGEDYEPSYYTLSDDNTTACLATGFSRLNGTNDQFKDQASAARISGDSLYNQVAFSEPDGRCLNGEFT